MAQFLLLCLILTDAFLVLAMANVAPIPSPSTQMTQGAPLNRKFGTQNHKFGAPCSSPSESPRSGGGGGGGGEENGGVDKEQELRVMKHHFHRHHSIDKSVAGGGVILGGLATTFLVAVFCYIRATGRKNDSEMTSSV